MCLGSQLLWGGRPLAPVAKFQQCLTSRGISLLRPNNLVYAHILIHVGASMYTQVQFCMYTHFHKYERGAFNGTHKDLQIQKT